MDTTDSESELVSLISQLHLHNPQLHISQRFEIYFSNSKVNLKFISLIIQIIRLVSTMDLDSQPRPLTRLMSVVTQTNTLFNSLDLHSQPKPLSELISFITRLLNSLDLDSQPKPLSELELISLISQKISPECDSEVESPLKQILAICMNSKWEKLISLCPPVMLKFEDGRFRVCEKVEKTNNNKLGCLPLNWEIFKLRGEEEDVTHFHCSNCNGENHEEYEKAPVEIKHPLHPKHSLQLVFWVDRHLAVGLPCLQNMLLSSCCCCESSKHSLQLAFIMLLL